MATVEELINHLEELKDEIKYYGLYLKHIESAISYQFNKIEGKTPEIVEKYNEILQNLFT
jgi:D-mannonate dehydratase